jgi:hypothetical protein
MYDDDDAAILFRRSASASAGAWRRSMNATERVLDRLDGVKQTAPDRWIARCPAHEDRSPSLSIRQIGDGRVLLHCFSGCQIGDILAAIGLELRDLYEGPLGQHFGPAPLWWTGS